MGRPGPATQAKRQRERKQKEKRKAKADERALRKEEKARNERPVAPGQDPDLEGIVPGPQPPLFD